MPIASFLDTNVLIYAAAGRTREPEKHGIARRLLLAGGFGISAQVLAECYVNVTLAVRLPSDQSDIWMTMLMQQPTAAIDGGLVADAVAIGRRYLISYRDAAILAAAQRLEAPLVYSEDLGDAQAYGAVRVVNPLRDAARGAP